MKVFLDDERPTPEGFVRTYSVEETTKLLLTRQVQFISLDNDLGSMDHNTEGYNILNWLEQEVFNDPTFPIPEMVVHSSNASRAMSMRQAIKKLELIRQQQIGGE
jgi:hypothetical protein